MGKPTPPPVPLFLAAPTVNLVSNKKLQDALQAAVTAVTVAGKPPLFGLTIIRRARPWLLQQRGSTPYRINRGFQK